MSSRTQTIDPKTALLIAYVHNINAEGDIANQVTEEIVQIGEGAYADWYETLEVWLESHSNESGAPNMKLIAAWAAAKRVGQDGDEQALKMADSIWETGERLVAGWKDSVAAWTTANPGLAPA
ncbi:hypothetical protein CB0940_06962 [Cercospora beticola]|uniref:Uncharacterized protein n=1 Tax=Cercospora beticola TaxID=122368 RepID=A0A2G5H9X2_CERBT|nr:hypothetical protein CB0940_06962 [Cercospora beticola]PIA89329.1 hypothetical protein CB0940_06962 [Cercospora beticola]WPB02880.1 hypothetical protein RHO25_007516 [Cercospora beticola]CAK1358425.1 unnamed protein product [Cercospora beticola]